MLSLSEEWYRKLMVAALVLGVGGGVIALVYSGVTNFGIGRLYGEPTSEAWSGQWWWIPLVSGGAVLVTALCGLWKVPKKVPGAVAFAKRGWVDPSSALSLALISAISLFVGAGLGPRSASSLPEDVQVLGSFRGCRPPIPKPNTSIR
jgi:hypothetical protein